MTAREQAIITIIEAVEDLDSPSLTVAKSIAGVLDPYTFTTLIREPKELHEHASRAALTLLVLVEQHPDEFRHLDSDTVDMVQLIAALVA